MRKISLYFCKTGTPGPVSKIFRSKKITLATTIEIEFAETEYGHTKRLLNLWYDLNKQQNHWKHKNERNDWSTSQSNSIMPGISVKGSATMVSEVINHCWSNRQLFNLLQNFDFCSKLFFQNIYSNSFIMIYGLNKTMLYHKNYGVRRHSCNSFRV